MDWNNPTVTEHMVLPFGLTKALQAFLRLTATISIGNSMICSDIWHKYHE